MANDKNTVLRVSLLESQMETLVEMVTEIRDNYVTKRYLDERLSAERAYFEERRLADKAYYEERRLADKAHFEERLSADRALLDERLSHYATKEDLARASHSMRNWVITVGISATALQFAMQYALFQLYQHAR